MFPKPQEVKGNYPILSASRDPFDMGRRIARAKARNFIFFGFIAVAALADLWQPALGDPYYYGVCAVLTLIPLLATVL